MKRVLVPALVLILMVLAGGQAPLTTGAVSAAVPADADLQQRRASDSPEKLPGVSSPRRHRADVVPHVRGDAARMRARSQRPSPARTMPPWFADPEIGHFENAKVLTGDPDRERSSRGPTRARPREREGQTRAGGLQRRVDNRQAGHRRDDAEGRRDSGDAASSINPTCSCTRISTRTCG